MVLAVSKWCLAKAVALLEGGMPSGNIEPELTVTLRAVIYDRGTSHQQNGVGSRGKERKTRNFLRSSWETEKKGQLSSGENSALKKGDIWWVIEEEEESRKGP